MSSIIFTFFKIFSGCQRGRHTVLYLSCYILNDVFYVFHLCEPFDVGAGEEEPVLYVAEYGVCEGLCDAVFRFCRIAYGDATVAVGWGNAALLFHALKERGVHGASRHTDRALNDTEIFFLCVQKDILIGLRGVA